MKNTVTNIQTDANGWNTYNMGESRDSFKSVSDDIFREVLQEMPFQTNDGIMFFNCSSNDKKTKAVKTAIAEKGSENNRYKIYGHGIESSKYKFKNHEWLFDLIWYKELLKIGEKYDEEKGYIVTDLELVLECEWKRNRDHRKRGEQDDPSKAYDDIYGEVKFDFQKLVIANAKHRVMIFQEQGDDLVRITKYIRKQIDKFKMYPNSQVLCIAYSKDFKSFRYQIFNNNNKNQ